MWSYTSRTLTAHAFPFTNPASAVDLSNVRVALQSDPLNIIRDAILNDATKFAGADIATILSEIQNGTYGLSALKTDLAAVLADVGDASSSTLGSLLAILGDPAQSFLTMIGYEGATSLAAKLTLTRAGYLDVLDSDSKYIRTTALTTITGYSLADLLYISNTEKLRDFIAKTGGTVLPASKSLYDVIALDRLDHATYGLSAIQTIIAETNAYLESGGAIYDFVDEIETLLKSATYGLSALKTLIDAIETKLDNATYGLSALKTLIDAVEAKLDNGTYGLSALKTLIDAIEAKLDNGTYGLSALNTDLDTLLTRVPAEVTQRAKSSFKITEKFFADSVRITVTSSATSQTIKSGFSISLIPSGITLDYVHVYVFTQVLENTNASANKVDGAQYIQIQKSSGGTWTNCASIIDDALRVPASTRDMGRLLGAPVDCKGEVDGNDTFDLQWASAQVDQDSMYLDDVFFIVEVGFH